MSNVPISHLSVRVPWHDTGWNGTVCEEPRDNASCLALRRIIAGRDDEAESNNKSRYFDEMLREEIPCCFEERVSFMASREQLRISEHAYAATSEDHKHIEKTAFRHPPYSFAAVPFRWLLKEHAWGEKRKCGPDSLVGRYGIDSEPDKEPTKPDWLDQRPWIQGHENQAAMSEAFHSAIKPNTSLVFAYAKRTPLVDDNHLYIVGVGRIIKKGSLQEYRYSTKNPRIRSFLWERAISHSIRPEGKDGFLLPYHDLVEHCKQNPNLNPSPFMAFIPNEYRSEFTYASEHVKHSTAIHVLLSVKKAITAYQDSFGGDWSEQLRWIDRCLGELWELRGPYPGMGSVLCAMGVEYGHQVAYYCYEKAGKDGDPWEALNAAVSETRKLPFDIGEQVSGFSRMWQYFSSKGEKRFRVGKLLSRMDITPEQATRWWVKEERDSSIKNHEGNPCTDDALIENPFLVYECDRYSTDPVAFSTVDQSVYPEKDIARLYPLEKTSAMKGPLDWRRLRAASVSLLEEATDNGHCLLPRSTIIRLLRDLPISPGIPASGDIFDIEEKNLPPALITCSLWNGDPAFQLDRLSKTKEAISTIFNKRRIGRRHEIKYDWRKAIDREFGGRCKPGSDEEKARVEKCAALEELASARFSLLVGPAGTGKTTLLKLLCDCPEIQNNGILLLAPTGKARVRMQQAVGKEALTLAQFLRPHRYNEKTGFYFMIGDENLTQKYKTIIVDEASMLTEEQLAALFDSFGKLDRIILVGDPGQLPPIGAGRPFVDMRKELIPESWEPDKPRISSSYAELTILRRQEGNDRDDLQLAEWFSGRSVGPGDDEIFARISSGKPLDQFLRVCSWSTQEELQEVIHKIIVDELKLSKNNLDTSFAVKALGAKEINGNVYFNRETAAPYADKWQILTPFRGQTIGTGMLNRLVQSSFRSKMLDFAQPDNPIFAKIPQPMGPDGIVYGDKVINIANHRRDVRNRMNLVYPEFDDDGNPPLRYVANGEIGIVTGPFRGRGKKTSLKNLNVAFSSQKPFAYTFFNWEIGEEESYLELAYALTIHKSQGSEFDLSIVVIPNPCRMLSRELLYTALTRQKERLVILCQGDIRKLIDYRHHSDTATRLTNLFKAPKPIEVGERIYDERHIHRSRRGEMMISKSEVIIANELHIANILYEYEKPFVGKDGTPRSPDFTYEDDDSGITWYWEHLGMLTNESYRQRWIKKKEWYRENDVLPLEEGGGLNGVLLTTDEVGGFDTKIIQEVIAKIRKGL